MYGLCCDGPCDLVGLVPFLFMGLVGIRFWRWHFVPWYFNNWLVILYCFAITHWNIIPNVAKHLMEWNIQHKQCTSYKWLHLYSHLFLQDYRISQWPCFSACALHPESHTAYAESWTSFVLLENYPLCCTCIQKKYYYHSQFNRLWSRNMILGL
jgi:hypothetical protein